MLPRRSLWWWLAVLAAIVAGVAGARVWLRPQHVTLPAPEEAAPAVERLPAPPARA